MRLSLENRVLDMQTKIMVNKTKIALADRMERKFIEHNVDEQLYGPDGKPRQRAMNQILADE